MMQQRIPSNKAMTSRVKAQEQVKQVHRVATRYKVDPISRKESIESFQEVLKNKYKRSQVPVVFEWDIQPGQVSQKFLVMIIHVATFFQTKL
jgi:hypothetical protein